MNSNYGMAVMAQGRAPLPEPGDLVGGELADVPNNNNIAAFKDATCRRADEAVRRGPGPGRSTVQLIRKSTASSPTGIGTSPPRWDSPFQRIGYWNRFGMPERVPVAHRRLYRHGLDVVGRPAEEGRADLKRAMGDESVKLPVGDIDVKYMDSSGEREKAAAAAK
ncbi:MAG: hypothetical protein QM736_14200 [Vicinamibacterales bacterium]